MCVIRTFCCVCIALTLSICPSAASAQHVTAENAWARATAPGQTTASVYVDLVSDVDAALVAVESPAAARAELHSMSVANGIMRMRSLRRIELPAGHLVKLSSGGIHLMLVELKAPLRPGEHVPLVLTIQGVSGALQKVNIHASVRTLEESTHQH